MAALRGARSWAGKSDWPLGMPLNRPIFDEADCGYGGRTECVTPRAQSLRSHLPPPLVALVRLGLFLLLLPAPPGGRNFRPPAMSVSRHHQH